jgi:hypothetical protein
MRHCETYLSRIKNEQANPIGLMRYRPFALLGRIPAGQHHDGPVELREGGLTETGQPLPEVMGYFLQALGMQLIYPEVPNGPLVLKLVALATKLKEAR